MSRSSVDLPHPDGPMREMNSPASIWRSIASSAFVRPPLASKILSTPATSTTGLGAGCDGRVWVSLMASSKGRSSGGRAGPAAEREELCDPNREEERQAKQRRREDRGPELLRGAAVLLVEVQDRPSEAELAAARVSLAHDGADDARRSGDLQRGEQVRQRRRHPELPEDRPARGRAAAHE